MRTKLRIISGKYKNRTLKSPLSARPFTDRVKRTMFDSVNSLLEDSKVLDLFAGSGNAGIESLSRGARHVTFVEKNYEAANCIRENITELGIPSTDYKVINKPIRKFFNSVSARFDLIFADPPFAEAPEFPTDWIARFLNKDGIAILRFEKKDENKIKITNSLDIVDVKEIGISKLLFLRLKDINS